MTQKFAESKIAVFSYDEAALLLNEATDEIDLGTIKIFITDGSAEKQVVVLNAMDSQASAVVTI